MSNETKNTAGPWNVVEEDTNERIGIMAESQMWIAEVIAYQRGGRDEERANAKLIAAAPEMLDALKKARHWLEGWASAEAEISLLDRVIAKAE
jgi:hypothetical protein